MENNEYTLKIFHQMFDNDRFSKWLGIELVYIIEGECSLKMEIREEMLNGFNISHGGITYSIADSAFAFASNSYGRKSVSLSTVMSYPTATKKGDIITATAKQVTISEKTAIFDVTIINQNNEIVGVFRGTVYRTSKLFEI
jgi:acyl-CoA thioesterase